MASLGIGALGEPTISHVFEHAFGGSIGHAASLVISVVHLLPVDHRVPEHRRRDRPEALHDPARRAVACWTARPLHLCRVLFSPFIVVLERRLQPVGAADRHRSRCRARGRHPGRDQADHRRLAQRRQPRRRRGEHADRRLPPARAGGAAGDDADPGGRHRRSVGDRPGRAAPLRRHRALAAGRHRGREPGPRQGDRPRQPARQADDEQPATRLTSTSSCARRRSSPRPSRWTTCSPTCSASAPSWRS